jgi:hypothetical protein
MQKYQSTLKKYVLGPDVIIKLCVFAKKNEKCLYINVCEKIKMNEIKNITI